jgi:DNA-binding transcriptional regulator YiaG
MERTTKIEMTKDELQQEREAAVVRTVERLGDDLPKNADLLAAAKVGRMTSYQLADLYDVTPETVRNWEWLPEPINPNGRPQLYPVSELPEDHHPGLLTDQDERGVGREKEYRRGYWDGYLEAVRNAQEAKDKSYTRAQEVVNILREFVHSNEMMIWRGEEQPSYNTPPEIDITDWKALREKIIERDNGECQRCGSTENLHVDHIRRMSNFGPPEPFNLQVLCEQCNIEKG